MPLFGRPDGVLAERVPLVRRFMPFLMRRRNESAVWFEQDVAADAALAFAESFSSAHGVRLTFFHLVLRGVARVLDEFLRLNRYVVGRRLYRRTTIAISFSGKESFDDAAALYVRERIFDPRIVARRVARLKYTYGERIEDGFYCARAVSRMEELIEHPERLV